MELIVLTICVLAVQACSALTVTQAPYDMAGAMGEKVTLACVVTDKTSAENVQWKFRANGRTTFNAITFNANIVGTKSKYDIVGTYHLTIINVTVADEGTYRCTAGNQNLDAKLTAVVLPTKMNITWADTPDTGNTVNLTCTATYGRPPPFIRWVINGMDMSTFAMNNTSALTSSGYGDVTSYLPLDLSSTMTGHLAECQATYDGWYNAMNATLELDINGGTSVTLSVMMMVVTIIFARLM